MANLKWSINGIPERALTITQSTSLGTKDDFPFVNTFSCRRGSLFRIGGTGTTFTMVYDLGSAGGSAADHLIIGRADLLQADNVTAVRLRHSADNVSYTTAFDNTTFDTETLVGTKSQDYIETFTETASRRYWELRLTAGSASKFTCSKIQFGKFFEFAYDVYRYTSSYVQKSKPFMAADGSLYYTKTQEDAYQYQLEYKGVTDTEANNFESYLFEPDKYGGFVYTAGETNLLDEHTLLHYKVASYRLTKTWNEWNDLAITLEEQL